ncbi:MAG: hypothetical protein ACRDXB_01800, partial [Actinomycetes bacterium]
MPTNTTPTLRDRIAQAIRDAACPGDGCPDTEEVCVRKRIQPCVWERGILTEVLGTPEVFADAVLAVLRRATQPEIKAAVATTARQVLGTTDQQPTTEQGAPVNWQAIVQQRERELKTVGDTAEAHRLALSDALGLGTGAPWDAIRDRAAELHAASAPVDRAAVLTEAERTMLTYAVSLAQERVLTLDGFTAESLNALTSLRRMADEAQQPETEAAKWAGATELAPDREIHALAATGLVGYRQGNGRLLH